MYQQQLLFNRKELHDLRLVFECGIQQGSTLHLTIRAAGGINIQFTFNKLDAMKKISYSHVSPKWRIVKPGISFWSKCITEGCDAFQKSIIVNKEFGSFDIAETTSNLVCPICQQLSDLATTCGFDSASWTFEGKLTSGEKRVIKGETSSSQEYHTFKDGVGAEWRYLKVTVQSSECELVQANPVVEAAPKSRSCLLV